MSDHWLARARTLRRLWHIFIAVLAVTVLAALFVEPHPHFTLERWFAFYAVYGFLSCAALIVVAKALGVVLKRRDAYYDD